MVLRHRPAQARFRHLTEQITTLERALHPYLIPNDDVQRLLCLPGLGKVNAFTLYTEIDGIARFPSARQFFSYSRLVPGADNSGGRTRHRSGSKAGNRYLKLAFSHAGIRAVQYHPEIRAFFKAKARKKPIRVARTLVALELARLTQHDCNRIAARLNRRPRKRLGYCTPQECYDR